MVVLDSTSVIMPEQKVPLLLPPTLKTPSSSCAPDWRRAEDIGYNIFLFTLGFFFPLAVIVITSTLVIVHLDRVSNILLLFRHCHLHLDEERRTQKARKLQQAEPQNCAFTLLHQQKLLFVFFGPTVALVHIMSTHDIARILEKNSK